MFTEELKEQALLQNPINIKVDTLFTSPSPRLNRLEATEHRNNIQIYQMEGSDGQQTNEGSQKSISKMFQTLPIAN